MAARIHTPTVLQLEAVECGAAALGSVLGYFGRWVPLEELRTRCGVSRDGVTASNILKGARSYGLEAKGWRAEPETLSDIKFPAIIHWGFDHFVVLEGLNKKWAYINDPSTGPRRVSRKVFNTSFTGITLAFKKSNDFKRGGIRPSAVRGVTRRVSSAKLAFAFIVLASLGLVIPGILVPTFSRVFIDHYLVAQQDTWLKPLLWSMLATALVQGLLIWLQQHQMLRMETKLAVATAGHMIGRVLRLPMTFFFQRFPGEVGSRIQLSDRLAQLLAGDLGMAVVSIFSMVFFALVMATYDLLLTGIGVLFAAINIWATIMVSRSLSDTHQALTNETGRLIGMTTQGLQMIETFKASGTENVLFSRIMGQNAKTLNSEQTLNMRHLMLMAVPNTLNLVAAATVLVIGGVRVMNGDLTVGMLVAFQGLMMRFLAPTQQLVRLMGQMQDAQACMDRVDDILSHKQDQEFDGREEPAAKDNDKRKLVGSVQLNNLTFGYNTYSPPLIKDFCLDTPPGSRIAIVGKSGCGKSTLARLISGLYQPWEGEVKIDETPLRKIKRDVLRDSVAVVDQDIRLFEGSIRDNLVMWDSTISEERLVKAAMDADIHDFIASRPGGYDSHLSENGMNLSGGQRSRLEIARALATEPSVLILDEATSALDPISEKRVMDNLSRRGCTCFIVAHRLSTIRDCDEIIVLEDGVPVQRGDHAILRRMDGPYKELLMS